MKYNVNMQMTEAEFIACTVLVERIVQRIGGSRWAADMADSVNAAHRANGAASDVDSSEAEVDPLTAALAKANADADALEAEAERRIAEGAQAWGPLMRTWAQNFEVPDAPQPDRAGALMAAFTGYPNAIGAYIRERGGLAGACIDTLARESIVAPVDAESVGKRIALNMVQVGSAIGLPTDGLIERSLVRRDDPDTLPLHGGPLADTVDMSRPEYK